MRLRGELHKLQLIMMDTHDLMYRYSGQGQDLIS
jgi:hypothetical protein